MNTTEIILENGKYTIRHENGVNLRARIAELEARIVSIRDVVITEQPEWEMYETNHPIWKAYLTRACNEALQSAQRVHFEEQPDGTVTPVDPTDLLSVGGGT